MPCIRWFRIAIVACLGASIAQAQSKLVVPSGPAPVIDGTIHPREWRGSAVVHATGADIYFRHDSAYLYIAIKARQPGYASVCFAHGDTVTVLQGPWAVGFGTYVRSGGIYRLAHGFDWQLRGNGKGANAAEERRAYVRGWGYLATTLPMNEMEKEMQIALDHLPMNPIPMAIIYRPDKGPYWGWPAIPRDDCGGPRLLAGIDLSPAGFDTPAWGQLVISRASAYPVPADLLLQ